MRTDNFIIESLRSGRPNEYQAYVIVPNDDPEERNDFSFYMPITQKQFRTLVVGDRYTMHFFRADVAASSESNAPENTES